QLFPTFQQRCWAQVDPVQVQQIEGDEDDPIRRPSHCGPQRMEADTPFLLRTIASPSMIADLGERVAAASTIVLYVYDQS
ncbi:hypothetical protein, partial [Mesorhizobium sp. M7A.F.Ca.US.005.03.1.1]|uniref:hypothetical protein n=1 Tax=Mesorhizobium sp. M7A.F.Ca.US.005.03.1.1 TaxID=2496736 RepID=UPI0019CFD609